ncbi:MAG: hypothetical protein AAFX87_18410 [Bacteroidota bacterium]
MNMNHNDDQAGEIWDLELFYNDSWLLDSAVIDFVVCNKGNWDIHLVFADTKFPLRLIKRKITKCITLRRAQVAADSMRRLAAKDQRGTLKVDKSDFEHCLN